MILLAVWLKTIMVRYHRLIKTKLIFYYSILDVLILSEKIKMAFERSSIGMAECQKKKQISVNTQQLLCFTSKSRVDARKQEKTNHFLWHLTCDPSFDIRVLKCPSPTDSHHRVHSVFNDLLKRVLWVRTGAHFAVPRSVATVTTTLVVLLEFAKKYQRLWIMQR